MSAHKRMSKVLALLIPTGVLGISSALASTQTRAEAAQAEMVPPRIADRLTDIRKAVSAVNAGDLDQADPGTRLMIAEWLNFGGGLGWRNGGWGNGGWHNAGWGNGGWHNAGWGNGGWHNAGWGNGGGWHNAGWGNGWHNFWHNW